MARWFSEGTPVLKVVEEESESNAHAPAAVGGSLLDEIVRDGARQMLAAALQAEVAAYVDGWRPVTPISTRRPTSWCAACAPSGESLSGSPVSERLLSAAQSVATARAFVF